MKNWKMYIYLLLTYIAMQVGSIYLAELLIGYMKSKPGLQELQATYHGFAWSLFIVNTIAAIIFLVLIARNKKFMQVFKGKKASVGSIILWGVIGFFLAMGGQMLAASIESMFGVTPGSDNTALLTDIAKTSPIVIISMVLFAPLLEELVFRRVIFGGIYMKTNFWIATLVSAVVFAAVHNELEHLLIYTMPALVFAYLYYRTKSILTPMIAHGLMNGFVVVVQLNYDKLQRYIEEMEKVKQAVIIFIQ
ncbi:CPBP family intramembrane metalloprotease [Sporosarcina sp. ACRSM]|uniref:CPBP family intramembrane glutamic endopeptidase n=1 Tax=Sporosarcina sp. ACRSM TaxID=2918216 RepID=UPI001EF41521|nr:CPBP family intramembrane glutamic endopeptidase [Sporosarcina sp. ACRSM]MCG7337187.1 CPBP family intramembrane metalloprotease [Sporosarcina sp. ACRSM]